MPNTPLKIAKIRDDWPDAIDQLRNGAQISISEQRLLADWVDELYRRSVRKRDREAKRNSKRRNRGSAGRPQGRPSDEWFRRARLERADARVESLHRIHGLTLTEARTKVAEEFGYKSHESLRISLFQMHKKERRVMFEAEDRRLRKACAEEFSKMTRAELNAYKAELEDDILAQWRFMRDEEFNDLAYSEENHTA